MLGVIIGDMENIKCSHFPKKCLGYSILTTLTIATMSSLMCPVNREDIYKTYINMDKIHSIPLLKWSIFNKDIQSSEINENTLLRVCPLVMKYSNYNILSYETNLIMEIFNIPRSNIDLCNTLTRLLYDVNLHNSLDNIESYISSKHYKSSLELTYHKAFDILLKSQTYEECITNGKALIQDKGIFHKEIILPTIYTLAELYYDTVPVKEYEILNRVLPNRYKLLIKNFYCRYASCRFITNDIITHLVTH